jgi:hypothetical protein
VLGSVLGNFERLIGERDGFFTHTVNFIAKDQAVFLCFLGMEMIE